MGQYFVLALYQKHNDEKNNFSQYIILTHIFHSFV